MISFGTKYWFFVLLAVLIGALTVVFILYVRNRENRELTRNQVRLLMVLRFAAFFLTGFLLLSPFIRNLKRIVENPVIITAWDNSASVVSTGDSASVAGEVLSLKEKITERLGDRYAMVNYTFGEEPSQKGDLRFDEKRSDYSRLLATIRDNHFNENIGAVIIAGDGIYNQGKNPVNMPDEITFPVYTIGLGDTTEVTDARIQQVRANRTSFSGNRFPVEVEAAFSKLAGRPLTLSIRCDGEKLAEKVITPSNEDYFASEQFVLEAGDPGVKNFTVHIESAPDERNKENNRAVFAVNVLENKHKILILSEGPHPDNGAIRYTLEKQQSYEVSLFTGEPYPSNFSDFNLVILNQLPTSRVSMAQLIEAEQNQRISVLFIVGDNTFLSQLNVLFPDVEIDPVPGAPEEAQAVVNPDYATFSLSEETREMIRRFPPLMSPYATYETGRSFTSLLYQRIKNVDTSSPLLVTGNINNRKTGFLFGEGIWRWRLYNYSFNQSHDQFDEMINQLIQYLVLRENEDNFRIDFQPVYDEIEDVVFHAEVYDEAFEPVTTGEVTMTVINEAGEEFQFAFDTRGNGYVLNAGNLPVGNYRFNGEVNLGEEVFRENGHFSVMPVHLEQVVTRANHRMLYQLAGQSGGAFYLPSAADRMITDIRETRDLRPVISFQEMVDELLNLRWLFFVLLLILSMEWFLRKFWGIY